MPLFKYEMKKMFFFHNGLLFIVLYFFFSIAATILFDTPTNIAMETDLQQYSHYLSQVKGKISDSTEQFLTEEAIRISEAEIALQNAYDNYYDGKISDSEFSAEALLWESTIQNKSGFERIYEQYTYVRESPDNRYFLYTNGWDGLLSHERLDLFFVLLLLLLSVPIFCYEAESEMDTFILTVKNGTKYHALCKVGLVLLTVTILSLFISVFQYGFYGLRYGLPNGNFPLQSLSYFGTSPKNITLLQTFLWITVCKLFGHLSFAMLVMFVSVYIKKYALTLFSCTAVLLLPYYALSLSSVKYSLPLPLGFIIAAGFYRGSEYERDIYTGQMEVVFREIPSSILCLLFTIVFCMGIGMFIAIRVRNKNAWSQKQRISRQQPAMIILTLCIAMPMLSGCVSNDNAHGDSIYNFSSRQTYENDDYLFYTEESGEEDRQLVFQNKETGAIESLIRNPLQSLSIIGDSIYGNGAYVYYMKFDFDKSRRVEAYDMFSIVEINTATFDERIIFEKNINTEKDSLLGIWDIDEANVNIFRTAHSFFLDKNNIYIITDSKSITRISRISGKSDNIIQSQSALTSIAFDGENIYYANAEYKVIKYDTKTNIETVIPNIATMFFVLTDSELIFINRKDARKIYSMSMEDFMVRNLTDKSARWFSCDKQYIHFQEYDSLEEHCIERD